VQWAETLNFGGIALDADLKVGSTRIHLPETPLASQTPTKILVNHWRSIACRKNFVISDSKEQGEGELFSCSPDKQKKARRGEILRHAI
jgi:hypothetical protein